MVPVGAQTQLCEISFLIPCLNEAESLGHVLDEILSSYGNGKIGFEIIVADNGSTDDSQAIAAARGARVIPVPERGYGAALTGGIEVANGRFVIMGDADGSYVFGDAASMVDRLRAGADVVMGNRFAGGIAPGAMPFLHRYLGNPVLSWLGRLFFQVPVRDFHCGLRAFDRQRIRELRLTTPGMEFASEMLVRAQKARYRIEEVPVRLLPDRRSRAPHLRTWRDGWRHLRFLLMHSPTWTFLIPATIVGLVSAFLTLLTVFGPVSLGSVEFSYRTGIVASALALISASGGWSSYLARMILRDGVPGPPLNITALLATSGVLLVAGSSLIVVQLLAWNKSGFGVEPVGQNMLMTIAGGFFLALGGLSFFATLLVWLLRHRQ